MVNEVMPLQLGAGGCARLLVCGPLRRRPGAPAPSPAERDAPTAFKVAKAHHGRGYPRPLLLQINVSVIDVHLAIGLEPRGSRADEMS